jgi:hypothetical protein
MTARKEILRLLKRITLEDEEQAAWWAELHRGTRGPIPEDWGIEVGKRGARIEEALARSSEAIPAPRRMERRAVARPTAPKDRVSEACRRRSLIGFSSPERLSSGASRTT